MRQSATGCSIEEAMRLLGGRWRLLLVSYLVVLAGNVMTAWFIVIPEVFAGYLRRPVEFLDYLRLAWLVASLATIGGALGSGLESSDTVRSATWGSRYRHDHRHRSRKH